MVFSGLFNTITQAGLNLLSFPLVPQQVTRARAGIAVGVNEAGDQIDAYGNRVSVAGYQKPKTTVQQPVAAAVVKQPAPIKRKEVLAMPQPAMVGDRPRFVGGQIPPNIFKQTPVSPRIAGGKPLPNIFQWMSLRR